MNYYQNSDEFTENLMVESGDLGKQTAWYDEVNDRILISAKRQHVYFSRTAFWILYSTASKKDRAIRTRTELHEHMHRSYVYLGEL
ncbi:MAG: hypothetical protein E6R04_08195 [Spirochaetes bacterium]|nr:MAG: hypothetical protein E6R04_08195 [Spirochaetota bacterium]